MGVKLRNEKTKSKFEKIVKILCAMLLAAIQIVGYSFSKQNNWNLVIKMEGFQERQL